MAPLILCILSLVKQRDEALGQVRYWSQAYGVLMSEYKTIQIMPSINTRPKHVLTEDEEKEELGLEYR